MSDLQILLVGEDNEFTSLVTELLGHDRKITDSSAANLKKAMEKIEPDAVVVLPTQDSPVEWIQGIVRDYPQTSVIYLHDQQDFQLIREVVRAGAADYLVIPDELNLLVERLSQISTTASQKKSGSLGAADGFKRGRGKVLSFYSGSGGSGRTFLSTAFAQTLKLESTAQVLFIDLNLQYGGAETYLGMETNRSIVDLSPVIQELNENHIRNVTEKEVFSNLELLISPRDAEAAESINEEYITKVVRVCRRCFDFVIIDLPTHIDEKTFAALEESDRIYYVMKLDTPSIRVLRNVEELYKRLNLHPEEKMELVLNETGKENELTSKDLSRFVPYPIAAEIRKDIKGVQQSVNQGHPVRKEANEKKLIPAAKDIQKWVSTILK